MFTPVDAFPDDHKVMSERSQRRLIWFFIVLGLLARSARYFLRWPLWDDECFLCANYIDRGYAELMQPLDYHQFAPLLFLWIELTLVKLFGFSEMVLRLFPFLCSIGSLFLFKHVTGRLIKGTPLVFAVALFAVAYPTIRYAAEAKQYSSNLFCALVLLALAVEWFRRTDQTRWLWLLAAFTPFAVGVSYPAVFVAGGVSLALLYGLIRLGGHGWIAWTVFNLLLVGSFAALFALSAANQAEGDMQLAQTWWQQAFVPLTSFFAFAKWFIATHTSDMLSYPLGGENGASTLTFLWWAAGLALLIWKRKTTLLLLWMAPWALHFIAAALQRYPYGMHFKFSLHLAPMICGLCGVGAIAWIHLFARRDDTRRRLLQLSLILLAVVAGGCMLRDIARPWKTYTDMRARAFARWFWFNCSKEGEVACTMTDLKLPFSPETYKGLGWSAMYLCNQRIYSPRHQRGEPLHLERMGNKTPLRCVLYRAPAFPFNETEYNRWRQSMEAKYRLVSHETFPFPAYGKNERDLYSLDYVEVFRFVPRINGPN